MPDHKLIGKNYTTADLYAKVTGRAKYAEDYRAEGMLFAKLLLSPLLHARVKRIDMREALALPGVKAILTADDLPAPADTITDAGTVIKASEPPVGGGCAAILNALSDALGDEIFRRAPVNLDTILTSLEAGRPVQHPLRAHI